MYRGEVPAVYDPPYRSLPDDPPDRGKVQVTDLSPESLKTEVPRQGLPVQQENIRIPSISLCFVFRMEKNTKDLHSFKKSGFFYSPALLIVY